MGSGFRSFAFGEVLTSANVQNYLMDQAVTVFAGTASRGSAITSPETGMVSYRTDGTADSKREGFEFYDGSTWVRMIPAAVASGLTLVKTQTIGSAVSSVEVTDAFSSTYANYRIVVSGGTASASGNLKLTLGATATGYYSGLTYATFAGVAAATGDNNATSWAAVGAASGNGLAMVLDLLQPNLAKVTSIAYAYAGIATTTINVGGFGGGFLNDTTQYTAFTIVPASGTLTGGTIRVYGYQNS